MRNILEELQPVFREVFDDDSIVLISETNADMIEDWDSLSHIRLVMAIEKKFGIKFSYDDLQNMKNVGEAAEIINRRLIAKESEKE